MILRVEDTSIKMLWFALFAVVFQLSAGFELSDQERLYENLFKSYHKQLDPGNITVKFGISLIRATLDESTGVLTANIWEKYHWSDRRLVWDPAKYEGVGDLRVPQEMLWIPDIMLYNSLEPTSDRGRTNAVIDNNGDVWWYPPAKHEIECQLDAASGERIWHCGFKFGSWSYDGFQLDLELYEKLEQVDLSDYTMSCKWQIVSNKAQKNVKYYPCCLEPYTDISFQLQLKKTTCQSV